MIIRKHLQLEKIMEYTFEGIAALVIATILGTLIGYYALKNTKKVDQAEDKRLGNIEGLLVEIKQTVNGFKSEIAVGNEKHKRHEVRIEILEKKVEKIGDEILTTLIDLKRQK